MATVKILATVWQRYLRKEAGGDTIEGNLLFFYAFLVGRAGFEPATKGL